MPSTRSTSRQAAASGANVGQAFLPDGRQVYGTRLGRAVSLERLTYGLRLLPLALIAFAVVLMSAVGIATAQEDSPSVQAAGTAAASSTPDDEAASAEDKAAEEPVELAVPLLERTPFDRITLNEANGNAVIETVLLDLPDRKVPSPLPTTGELEIRQISQPTIAYTVDWSAIAKIELFEQMLLAEAQRLTAANQFAEAFDYFAFLKEHYPNLPGLEEAVQLHLWREASAAYAAGRRQEAWPVLHALYLRNSNYPRLVNAVQAVSDDLVKERLQQSDYKAARAVIDSLEQTFPQLQLGNVAGWREKFQADAATQMAKARAALAAEQYSEARRAVNHARAILPDIAGGDELWRQIQGAAPEIRVGVTQLATLEKDLAPPLWAATRIADLVSPRLIEMVDFGAEGGVYASPWAEVKTDDDGLQTSIQLAPIAFAKGLTSASLALRLVEMAAEGSPQRQEDFAALASGVSLDEGTAVEVAWRHPHVRPEALLQVPLRWLTAASRSPGLWFEAIEEEDAPREHRFQQPSAAATQGAPRYIVERTFPDDDAALSALVEGEIDVIDRAPPWQLERLRNAQGIVVEPYRLPTIHVLIPNYHQPLMEVREFRRALCYGINAQSIVRDILLGGQEQPGFRPVSGPFAAGVGLNDPVGYAYNTQLQPRPYEPRLAALLSGLARTTLAKREEAKKKAEAAKAVAAAASNNDAAQNAAEQPAAANEATDDADAQDVGDESGEEEEEEEETPPLEPLLLAHSTDPIARIACQTIKIQLDQIGIPIKLAEFNGLYPPKDLKYDLLYAELTAWEPIVDARRVLGPDGVAGRAGALMASALDELSRSANWNQAADRLKEIHRIAYYDLPVIPLWQTINYCAYREEVEGVGNTPVSLYQNVSAWRKTLN